MKLKFCKFIALIAFFLLIVSSVGCRSIFVNNPEKKAAKKHQKEYQETVKGYRSTVKDHYDNQSKKTKRRMKRNLRRAERDLKKRMPKAGWECR